MIDDVTFIFGSASRLAAPLLFVALGELIAERAGALNISVEAMMLGSAYAAALGSDATGSALGGLLIGIAAGVLIATVQAQMSHRLTFNQFVVGLTLNLLVLGLTSYLFAQVDMETEQFGVLEIPGLADIPVVGEALFEQRWPFYLLYLLVPAVWWVLRRSRWGMELHAVGDDPVAADVSGIDVNRRRRQAILTCGALAGLGGAHLAVGVVGRFSQNMTAGRGFIAIAAVIFGGWTLWGTLGGCFVFGGADALRLALPAIGVTLNPQLLISAPYLLALIAMVFVARGKRQPATLGREYRRGFT